MKRIMCTLLAFVMVLGLCACGAAEKKPVAEKASFQAGFGRVNVTPSYSIPLSGYGNTSSRMSQGFMDYIYVTCIAFRDAEGETILLYSCDVLYILNSLYKQYKDVISKSTGVKPENVIVAATHTHSGPDQASLEACMVEYRTFFQDSLVQAAKEALKDLAPVTIQTGAVDVEGLNFVRHYLMKDGSYYGDNFGSTESGYAGHEREADKEMQIIRLDRADESKQDILMLNWQAHAKIASTVETSIGKTGREMISADYIGPLRENVEKETGMVMAYFLGATGNLNGISKIREEQNNVPEDYREYGKQLSQYVVDTLPNLKTVETGTIIGKTSVFTAQIDHTEDHLVQYALPLTELWAQTNTYSLCTDLDHGIVSPYHALSIVSRSKMTATQQEMEINAFTIGNIGFATVPYEMFSQNGQAVKDGSPYETTFMITCCNGANAYIAAEAAFEYNNGQGSYEVHNRTFIRGTAEAIQDELISMLNGLNG